MGPQKIQKSKVLKIKIRSAQNVGEIFSCRKKASPPHLGPSRPIFSTGRKNHKNAQFLQFLDFPGPHKKWAQMAPNGARRIVFLLIQTLPTFWAERILILRTFIFLIFWVPNLWLGPTHLGPTWAHPLGPRVGPPTWARLGPTHLGPAWAHPLGFPDAAAGAGAGRILKSRSRPLPTHPGMKYFRKETLAVDLKQVGVNPASSKF